MTYSTGLDPIQVVAARLTNNGLLDLVVLNEGSDDISIFLNNGHGGFIAMPRVDAGDNPTSLAVSDVTGDGCPTWWSATPTATSSSSPAMATGPSSPTSGPTTP